MTRILYITARADIGGGQECLYRLAKTTNGNSDVFIASPKEEPYWSRFADLLGEARLVEIPHRRFNLPTMQKLCTFVRDHAIQLIHSHGFGAGLYGRPVAILSGVPAVHTFHGMVFNPRKPLWTLSRLAAEWMLSLLSKRLIAVSKSEETHLRRWLFAYAGRMQKIHNGISSGEALNRTTVSPNGPTRILWVGRMGEQKDPLQAVDIAKQLRQLLPVNSFTIEMVGGGPLMGELRGQIVQHGLEEVVLLRGPRAEVRPYYQACDILLSTSRWEGLATCIVEAMEAGLLVVASGIPGNLDIVEHSRTGLIFAKHSPQQAAELLSSVSQGGLCANGMREEARRRILSEFGIERFADEHLRLYESIVREKGSGLSTLGETNV